jgi:signal recognition particle receptor subunit beta
MVVEGLTVRCWDLGGHQAARQLWAKYAAMADGLIFVVDAADGARIQEAAQELRALIGVLQPAGAADSGGGGGGGQAAAQHSSSVPVAILANKSDLKHALSPAALADALRLNELPYTRL